MVSSKESFQKCNCSKVIRVLIILALVIFIFKVGFVIGRYKSGVYSNKTSVYHKSFGGYEGKGTCEWGDWKKALHHKKAFMDKKIDLKKVTELTNFGFVVVDGEGVEQIVVVNESTTTYKDGEKTDGLAAVGDMVFLDGELNDSKELVATIVKILNFKK